MPNLNSRPGRGSGTAPPGLARDDAHHPGPGGGPPFDEPPAVGRPEDPVVPVEPPEPPGPPEPPEPPEPPDPPEPPQPPEPPEPPTLDAFVDLLFAVFDGDANATISLDEMLAVLDPEAAHRGFDRHVGRLFASVDANGDDGLDRAELESAITHLDNAQDGPPEEHAPGRLHASTVQLVGAALRAEDMPDDGG